MTFFFSFGEGNRKRFKYGSKSVAFHDKFVMSVLDLRSETSTESKFRVG